MCRTELAFCDCSKVHVVFDEYRHASHPFEGLDEASITPGTKVSRVAQAVSVSVVGTGRGDDHAGEAAAVQTRLCEGWLEGREGAGWTAAHSPIWALQLELPHDTAGEVGDARLDSPRCDVECGGVARRRIQCVEQRRAPGASRREADRAYESGVLEPCEQLRRSRLGDASESNHVDPTQSSMLEQQPQCGRVVKAAQQCGPGRLGPASSRRRYSLTWGLHNPGAPKLVDLTFEST